MKKILLSLIMLSALVVFGVTQAEAVNPATIDVTVTITAADLSVAVSLTSWNAGSLGEGGSNDTGAAGLFTVSNDTINRTETFSIVALASTNWSPAATAADEKFVMEALGGDLTSLTSIHTSQILETDVAPAGTVGLDLKVTVPTATDHGGVAQIIPVQITAS